MQGYNLRRQRVVQFIKPGRAVGGKGNETRFIAWLAVALVTGALTASPAHAQVATTLDNFFLPGTQPDTSGGKNFERIVTAEDCAGCHEIYNPFEEVEYPIYSRWAGSMMANAARDPLFHAALAVANQDADFAGDICIRCHSPGGWLEGRSLPTDGSALTGRDFEGVTCNFCHRMVDPDFKPGVSPSRDQPILDALANAGVLPLQPGNAGYVVETIDVRRGPFDDIAVNFHFGVDIVASPFHTQSELCATCHDVSNPAFVLQPDGSYALNTLGVEHPTLDKVDMFPLERTYSEWANSQYATLGVQANGVFGGNHPTGVMRTCQDCHMPDDETYGCGFETVLRPNIPSHDFNGGNTWMQEVLANLYPFEIQPEYLQDSRNRARYMLQNAATLELTCQPASIRVRVVNETGHKLPTGYPEGRRMWIQVEFRNSLLETVAERGLYDTPTADLTVSDTTVFEAKLGLDAAVAAATGQAEGPSFHFALNNRYYKDNRIPPRGFSNAAFAAAQAAPVAEYYADGQYWHDTFLQIPSGATSAVVSLYYQTSSKEYITFLRDENVTNGAGDLLYDQWELTGKSPPVLMRQRVIGNLQAGVFADGNCDGLVDLNDHRIFQDCVAGPNVPLTLGCEALDGDLDGDVDLDDLAEFQTSFLSGF